MVKYIYRNEIGKEVKIVGVSIGTDIETTFEIEALSEDSQTSKISEEEFHKEFKLYRFQFDVEKE